MNTATALKTVEENNMYIDLMQQNIDAGFDVELSQNALDALVKQSSEAKAFLANSGIITI